MASFVARMVGAARLEPAVYEEVEADRTATMQAMGVVILSSLAMGVGALGSGEAGFIGGVLTGLIGWIVWAFLSWIIGTKILPEPGTQSDMGELLRTLGFSSSPGVIRIFGWVPLIGGFITMAALLWMLVSMVVAVRQALDYTSTGRAVIVCVIGWFVHLVITVWVAALFGIALFGLSGMSTP
ncbi:MAG TPA: YIP1 family protein [Candidatus Eisenbacteria bacterium]|nr:YIP1 family protein [Candidatus Eisenbacteria bacterium]